MLRRLLQQPTVISEFVRQLIFLALVFNWINWTDQQLGSVMSVLSGFLSIATYALVVPTETIKQAGQLPADIKATAAANVAAGIEPKS